jgi:molybdopterin converting factor small subunit
MTMSNSVTIHVPPPLRERCGGVTELFLSAPSVRVALAWIEQTHPALYRGICDDTGAVRRHVNIFVNTSSIRDEQGLDTAVGPGDIITIMPAVSGG